MTLLNLKMTIYYINSFTLTQCETWALAHKADILGEIEGGEQAHLPFKAATQQWNGMEFSFFIEI